MTPLRSLDGDDGAVDQLAVDPRLADGRLGFGVNFQGHEVAHGATVAARREANAGKSTVAVVPVTLPTANAYVARLHRHHAPIPGGFGWWCVAAIVDGHIAGVAIAGRPTNRNNDDGQTVEVLRVAADGTPNVPSALLGACARAAKAIGAARCITYTLDVESGASLRGAGWTQERTGITSWWTAGTSRTVAVDREHMSIPKVRWAVHFRNPINYEVDAADASEWDQLSLDGLA